MAAQRPQTTRGPPRRIGPRQLHKGQGASEALSTSLQLNSRGFSELRLAFDETIFPPTPPTRRTASGHPSSFNHHHHRHRHHHLSSPPTHPFPNQETPSLMTLTPDTSQPTNQPTLPVKKAISPTPTDRQPDRKKESLRERERERNDGGPATSSHDPRDPIAPARSLRQGSSGTAYYIHSTYRRPRARAHGQQRASVPRDTPAAGAAGHVTAPREGWWWVRGCHWWMALGSCTVWAAAAAEVGGAWLRGLLKPFLPPGPHVDGLTDARVSEGDAA
ncbi:uncharacterized protein K452DRAFT_10262 [Aplosporella prunicola CBS 121167]|uniref:Uncharacterized protein n=1 Tax=Aplosporella prunicola CBS 121167 TaxID=1176127 RepID=A0A6A6BH36_9PEZI|nr:uncharacterized protein K452DRAFT_10262 [Aplosporella prunicola CBS 121167]KAF2142753.1 hypothetical protein K452DRAFT_10262 [Aplosporella prunicola CBS 121167]